jgi:hypothetical protein
MTNAECVARWRLRHPKPPKPPEPDLWPELRTFDELAQLAGLLPEPPEAPFRNGTENVPHLDTPVFDPEALLAGVVFFDRF